MSFDRPTLATIYNRMKADLEQRFDNTNWASRALALILIAVFGGAIYLCYGFLRRLAKQLFFTTALDSYVKGSFYDYLKAKAKQKGISGTEFRKLLQEKALLLLDGLDLLALSDDPSLLEEISSFISDYEDCRYVIASRHGPSIFPDTPCG